MNREDRMRRRAGVIAIVCATWAGVAHAQVLDSSEASVSLTATLAESLSLSVPTTDVSFSLTGGSATNPGNATISVTTTYTLSASRTTLALYAYFTTAATALLHTDTNNTENIPSSRVQGSVNGGTATAFTQTVAFGGAAAGLELFSIAVDPATSGGERTDTLALNINLASLSLPADVYAGTLHIRAQATP